MGWKHRRLNGEIEVDKSGETRGGVGEETEREIYI